MIRFSFLQFSVAFKLDLSNDYEYWIELLMSKLFTWDNNVDKRALMLFGVIGRGWLLEGQESSPCLPENSSNIQYLLNSFLKCTLKYVDCSLLETEGRRDFVINGHLHSLQEFL